MPDEYSILDVKGLKLAWRRELEGGGRRFGRDFVPVVRHLFGPVGRLYEFCAGSGYIGFLLFASGLCEHLVLSDVNPRAIDAIRETIRINGLEGKVSVYESDGLDGIPSDEYWDLVVSNPPHFATPLGAESILIHDDPAWQLHRRFFERVGDHLTRGASVLFQENSRGGRPEDFLPLIAEGGLTNIRTLWYPGGWSPTAYFFFLWAKKLPPGMVIEDGATAAVLSLREPPAGPLELPADRPCEIELVNETRRPVTPQLVHESGKPAGWLPFADIAPGAKVEFPLVALRAGELEMRDKNDGATLARLVVREPEASA